MWDPPRPGLEHVSPQLAGRFSTTAPPGKPDHAFLCLFAMMTRNLVMEWLANMLLTSVIVIGKQDPILIPHRYRRANWYLQNGRLPPGPRFQEAYEASIIMLDCLSLREALSIGISIYDFVKWFSSLAIEPKYTCCQYKCLFFQLLDMELLNTVSKYTM